MREEQHLHLMDLSSLFLCSSSRHLLILAWAVIDGQLLAAFPPSLGNFSCLSYDVLIMAHKHTELGWASPETQRLDLSQSVPQ